MEAAKRNYYKGLRSQILHTAPLKLTGKGTYELEQLNEISDFAPPVSVTVLLPKNLLLLVEKQVNVQQKMHINFLCFTE